MEDCPPEQPLFVYAVAADLKAKIWLAVAVPWSLISSLTSGA